MQRGEIEQKKDLTTKSLGSTIWPVSGLQNKKDSVHTETHTLTYRDTELTYTQI